MALTLLALHGYSQKGAMMREQLAGIDLAGAELVCLDAPHPCRPESVQRLYALTGQPVPPPPHLSWWDASEDGSVYHGWDVTRDLIHDHLRRHERIGVLGFSQGAILAASIAALSHAGELPPLACAIIIAGRIPRATALAARFTGEIAIPSLHVMGERDLMTPAALSTQLSERFAPAAREVLTWPGPHVIPTRGPAAARIADFVRGRVVGGVQ